MVYIGIYTTDGVMTDKVEEGCARGLGRKPQNNFCEKALGASENVGNAYFYQLQRLSSRFENTGE